MFRGPAFLAPLGSSYDTRRIPPEDRLRSNQGGLFRFAHALGEGRPPEIRQRRQSASAWPLGISIHREGKSHAADNFGSGRIPHAPPIGAHLLVRRPRPRGRSRSSLGPELRAGRQPRRSGDRAPRTHPRLRSRGSVRPRRAAAGTVALARVPGRARRRRVAVTRPRDPASRSERQLHRRVLASPSRPGDGHHARLQRRPRDARRARNARGVGGGLRSGARRHLHGRADLPRAGILRRYARARAVRGDSCRR